jgi:hypothetical protein
MSAEEVRRPVQWGSSSWIQNRFPSSRHPTRREPDVTCSVQVRSAASKSVIAWHGHDMIMGMVLVWEDPPGGKSSAEDDNDDERPHRNKMRCDEKVMRARIGCFDWR